MAGWITHSRIADKLLRRGLDIDAKSFCIGNIAPDCNVENEDWSAFTPSREVTHWMSVKNDKLTADYEAFYARYIENRHDISTEERSFLLGYYAHLVTDVESQRFFRDDNRIRDVFARIAVIPEMYEKVVGLPLDMDTLKAAFGGRKGVTQDVTYMENRYLLDHPDSVYNTIVRKTEDFPDYLDYLPIGAIPRKIRIMAGAADPNMEKPQFIFYSEVEYDTFIRRTTDLVHSLLLDKLATL